MSEQKKTEDKKNKNSRYHIMTLFGVPLEVSSQRLARLLKADVKDVFTADIGELESKIFPKEALVGTEGKGLASTKAAERVTKLPDHDSFLAFKSRIETIGEALEFEIKAGGVWQSPTNVVILVRYCEKPCGQEKARNFVSNLSDQMSKLKDESSGLFVVSDQLNCDVFKVAIKSRNLYDKIRVITFDNLNEIFVLKNKGLINHKQVATLLVPLENIDVGELLNVIKATHAARID